MTIYNFIFFVGVAFIYLIVYILSFPLSLLGNAGRFISYFIVQKELKAVFMCSLVSARITGLELIPKDRSLLFVCGRPRRFFYYYLIAFFPMVFRLVAEEELYRMPIIGRVFKAVGCIRHPKDEQDKKAAWVQVGQLFHAVKAKQNVLFFYENLRGVKPGREERRTGVVEIARKAGADIVPIVVTTKGIQRSKHIFAIEQIRFVVRAPITVGETDKAREIISNITAVVDPQ